MDNQDQRAAVRKLTGILRQITRIVQFVPFVYLAIYSIGLITETCFSEEWLCSRDSVAAVSPTVNIGLLFFSRILELCRWHKFACLFPLTTPAAGFVDNYIFQFTQTEVVVINTSLGIIALVFLVHAYFHFFGRQNKKIKQ